MPATVTLQNILLPFDFYNKKNRNLKKLRFRHCEVKILTIKIQTFSVSNILKDKYN